MVGGAVLIQNFELRERTLKGELRAIARLATSTLDADLTDWIVAIEADVEPGVDAGHPLATERTFRHYLETHPLTESLSLLGPTGGVAVHVGSLGAQDTSAMAAAMDLPAIPPDARQVFSGVFRDPNDGKTRIGVAVPIRHGSAVDGLILCVNRTDTLAAIVRPDDAKLDWQAAIIDQNNVLIAHSNPALVGHRFEIPQWASESGDHARDVHSVLIGGVESFIVLRTARLAPWRVVYMAPAAVLDDPLQRPALLAVLIGLLALSIAASALLGRYLGRRVEALAEAARLVSAEAALPATPPTGLREIDVVSEALQHAAELIKERTAARERMYDMEQVLHRAERVESLGQLTAGIAHDFGNLVFTLRGNLELIRQAMGGDERVQRLVEPALRLADEAAELIAQLSSGVRHRTCRVQRVRMDGLLNEFAELLRHVAGRAVKVTIEPGSGPSHCRLDPTLLKSALFNLVLNARTAMRAGGTIRIRTENLVLDEQAASAVGLAAPGRYVALSVADSGGGIPPDLLPRIFEPFFTTRASGSGTGIGLSMVHGFVRSSGGHITVRSTPGVGTIFTLYFPAEPPLPIPIDSDDRTPQEYRP